MKEEIKENELRTNGKIVSVEVKRGHYVWASGRVTNKKIITFKTRCDMFDYYDWLQENDIRPERMEIEELKILLEEKINFDRKDYEIGEEE